jgi:hypothetical protein
LAALQAEHQKQAHAEKQRVAQRLAEEKKAAEALRKAFEDDMSRTKREFEAKVTIHSYTLHLSRLSTSSFLLLSYN